MSALAGAVWMQASGERFALILPEDLEVDGRLPELADWFCEVGPRLGVVHPSKRIGLGGEPGQHVAPLGMVGFSGPVVVEVQEPDVASAAGSEAAERVLRDALRLEEAVPVLVGGF